MLVAGIILICIALVYIVGIIIMGTPDERNGASCGILTGGCIILGMICLMCHFDPQPKPIDVYRGHTTLEYIVVDGQPTDSTVIFKPGYLDSLKNSLK